MSQCYNASGTRTPLMSSFFSYWPSLFRSAAEAKQQLLVLQEERQGHLQAAVQRHDASWNWNQNMWFHVVSETGGLTVWPRKLGQLIWYWFNLMSQVRQHVFFSLVRLSMERLIPPFAAKKYMMINGIAELPCINVSQGYCQVVDWNVEQIRYFHALGWSSLLNVPAIHLKNLQPPRCRVKSEQSRPANSVHVRRSMVNGSHQIFFISDGVSKVDLFQGCRKRSISGSIFWEIFNHIWETWVSQLDGWPIQGWYSSFSHRLVYKPIYSRYTQIYRDLSKPKSNLSIITRWDRQMFIYIYTITG